MLLLSAPAAAQNPVTLVGTPTVDVIGSLVGTAGTPSTRVLSVQGVASGTPVPVSVASLPLPAGAATSALQTTGNTSLGSIDTKTPALGQALAAASVPVILPSATITTLTPPAAITGFATSTKQSDGTAKTQLVDGSGNVIASTSNAINAFITGGSSSGTQYTEDAAAAADPVGNAVILVRKDTPSTTVSADGDNIAQRGTNYGAAYVTLLDTGGTAVSVGGGTQYTEDAAAAADPIGNALIVVRKDTPSATVSTDGDNIALRGTNFGAVYTTALDPSGAVIAPSVDGTTNTTTPSTGPVQFLNGSTAVPTAVGGDQRAVAAWGDLNGRTRVTGDASMVALKVDPSGVTSPVSLASVPSHAVTNAGTFAAQVTQAPTAASGDAVSACNILATASTNSTNCKGSAGNLFGYEIYNTTTTVYYLRLYNASSAPTCTSATGFIRSIPIPPAGAAGQVGGAIKAIGTFGVQFGTGIGYCITGGSTSTDNTNAAAGVFGEINYK